MSHIKINYTKLSGERTSTTINRNIAFHFYLSSEEAKQFDNLPKDLDNRIKTEVQNFVNGMDVSMGLNKSFIESELLAAMKARIHDEFRDRLKNMY